LEGIQEGDGVKVGVGVLGEWGGEEWLFGIDFFLSSYRSRALDQGQFLLRSQNFYQFEVVSTEPPEKIRWWKVRKGSSTCPITVESA